MNETNLYNRARIALASTLLLPLAVAGLGAAGTGADPVDAIKGYVQTASDSSTTADTKTADEAKDTTTDTATNTGDTTTDTTAGANSDSSSTTSGSSSSAGSIAAKAAGSYTVKEGDTYGCIAENYYGSYSMWPAVQAANVGPGYSEYGLNVGAQLVMPAADTSQLKTDLCS